MSVPPRWMLRRLRQWLPQGSAGDTILGDLHEEYQARRPGWARDVWYLAAAVRTVLAYHRHGRDKSTGAARPDALAGRRQPAGSGGAVARAAADLAATRRRPRHSLAAAGTELRQSVRSLGRQPTHTVVALLTLALGICATTAIFSIIDGALLQPLPYAEAERLLRVGSTTGGAGLSSMSMPNVEDLRSGARGISGIAAYQHWWFNLSALGADAAADIAPPIRVSGLRVEPGFFGLLGVPPSRGRDFSAQDVAATAPVIIIGDRLWRSRFGADAAIVGRQVMLDLVPRTVVGVLPPDFAFLRDPQVFVPLPASAPRLRERRARQVDALARLAPDVTLDAGVEELRARYAALAESYPESNEGWSVNAVPALEWRVRDARRQLWLFGGAVALVLAVACTNVANLSLVRAETRHRELSVRAALGAGRAGLVRLLVVENVLLAIGAAALAAAATPVVVRVLVTSFGTAIPRAEEVAVDARALLFTIGLGVLTGVFVGLVAALQVGRQSLVPGMSDGARGATSRRRLRESLIVVEVALAVVLVSGATLLLGSVARLRAIDLGVEERGVLTFALGLPAARYTTPDEMNRFWDELISSLEGLAGVEAVGLATRAPLNGGTNGNMSLVGGEGESPLMEARAVTAGYFRALGMQLLAGRMLQRGDREAGGGVLVNEAFARAMGNDVLGEAVSPDWSEEAYPIVGIVSDVRDFGPTASFRPTVYWHVGGGPIGINAYLTAAVRSSGDPMALFPLVRDRIRALDRDIPLVDVATLEELAVKQLGGTRRAVLSLLSGFAVLATLLGAVGIYAMMSYGVTQRTRELGVRVALGATPSSVQRLVVGHGLRLAGVGVVCGLLLSLASGAVLESLLYAVTPRDSSTLLIVAAVMLATALLACWWPARRAARIEVVDAIRR